MRYFFPKYLGIGTVSVVLNTEKYRQNTAKIPLKYRTEKYRQNIALKNTAKIPHNFFLPPWDIILVMLCHHQD